MKLNLSGKGSRLDICERLTEWHRMRHEDDTAIIPLDQSTEEHIPMNVIGNNFANFPVIVDIKKSKDRRRKKSLVSSDENNPAVVSPSTLRPFRVDQCETPRSILKCRNRNFSSPPVYKGGHEIAQKLDKITFSPYNSVKIIAHRTMNDEDGEFEE